MSQRAIAEAAAGFERRGFAKKRGRAESGRRARQGRPVRIGGGRRRRCASPVFPRRRDKPLFINTGLALKRLLRGTPLGRAARRLRLLVETGGDDFFLGDYP